MSSDDSTPAPPAPDPGPPPGAVPRTALSVVPLAVLWALAFTGTTPFYPTLVVGGLAMVGLAAWVRASSDADPARDGASVRSVRGTGGPDRESSEDVGAASGAPSDEVSDAPEEASDGAGPAEARHGAPYDGAARRGAARVDVVLAGSGFPGLRLTARTVWFALVVALVHYLVGAALYVLASRFVPAFAETASTTYERAEVVPLWLAVLVGGLVSAPLEEVFWRGAVQPVVTGLLVVRWPAMRQRPVVPIVTSAVVYALFHAATTQLALIAAALLGGLVWGWLLHRTRSLGAVMVAHTAWTCLMLLAPPGSAL